MCASRRLRPACASIQADQTFCWPGEGVLNLQLALELPMKTDRTVQIGRLICVFAGRICNLDGNAVP